METLNFLLSPTMVTIYLACLFVFFLYKSIEEDKKLDQLTKDEPEDIEGHIAGIHESETPGQAIDLYRQGNRYNELRSEAFIEKMAQFHQDPQGKVFS